MATWAQKDQMNQAAMIVERGVDELHAAGLEGEPARLVRPPLIKGSPVHFECRRVDAVKMRPIARLGYKDYASVESVFQMEKLMPEDKAR